MITIITSTCFILSEQMDSMWQTKNVKCWGMKGSYGWASDYTKVSFKGITTFPATLLDAYALSVLFLAADLWHLGSHSPVHLTEQMTREIWKRCWSLLGQGPLIPLLRHQKHIYALFQTYLPLVASGHLSIPLCLSVFISVSVSVSLSVCLSHTHTYSYAHMHAHAHHSSPPPSWKLNKLFVKAKLA